MRGQRQLPGLGTRPKGPTCRYCGDPIRFLRLASGALVPVDRRPSRLRGTLLIRKGVAHVLSTPDARLARARGVPVFVLHRESCVAAGQFVATTRPARRAPAAPQQPTLEVLR